MLSIESIMGADTGVSITRDSDEKIFILYTKAPLSSEMFVRCRSAFQDQLTAAGLDDWKFIILDDAIDYVTTI